MKYEITLEALKIIAENELEETYLSNTLGLVVVDKVASIEKKLKREISVSTKGLSDAIRRKLRCGPATALEISNEGFDYASVQRMLSRFFKLGEVKKEKPPTGEALLYSLSNGVEPKGA